MPKELDDCVKQVKAGMVKKGKSEKVAEKSAWAICVSRYKKKHGKVPEMHNQGKIETINIQKTYGNFLNRTFEFKTEMKKYGEFDFITTIPAILLDTNPVNNKTTEKREQICCSCLETATPRFNNIPIWYGHQRTDADLLGYIINPKYNNDSEEVVGDLHLYGRTPLQRAIVEKVNGKEITHVSSSFVPDIELPIEDDDNELTYWQVGIRPIEVSIMPSEGEAYCDNCKIIHSQGACPTDPKKEKTKEIEMAEENDKKALAEAVEMLKKYGSFEAEKILNENVSLKTEKAKMEKDLTESKKTFDTQKAEHDKILKEYGEYKMGVEKAQKETTLTQIIGKLELKEDEVEAKKKELGELPQDTLDGIMIGLGAGKSGEPGKSYGKGVDIKTPEGKNEDKETDEQARARRATAYSIKLPVKATK